VVALYAALAYARDLLLAFGQLGQVVHGIDRQEFLRQLVGKSDLTPLRSGGAAISVFGRHEIAERAVWTDMLL
jgi:hypothetical protein